MSAILFMSLSTYNEQIGWLILLERWLEIPREGWWSDWRTYARTNSDYFPISMFLSDFEAGIVFDMGSTKDRQYYNVTSSLIGWTLTQNDFYEGMEYY